MSKRIISALTSGKESNTAMIAVISALAALLVMMLITGCNFVAPQKPAAGLTTDQSVFRVNNLVITPAQANRGEYISVVAYVTNTGNATGLYNAELKVNESAVASSAVNIPAGATQAINFKVPANNAGTYKAIFGGLTGNYSVVDLAQVTQVNNTTVTGASNNGSTASCCDPSNAGAGQATTTGAASCCTSSAAPAAPVQQSSSCCGR
jgi:hypothetical protein